MKELEQYTVIGFWNDEDERHVIGVIKGEQDVRGGVEVTEGGLFAELVYADSYEAAEEQVHGTAEDDEDEDDETPYLSDKFTVLDNPNPMMDQQFEYEEVVNLPERTVWTVVEGDNGKLYAVTGVHFVNRLYFAATKEEWTDEDEEREYKW
jgi:hypothetical protein